VVRTAADPWYGVRTIYLWPGFGAKARRLFEERVVLLRARSESLAIRTAEREARRYARENSVKYLGLLQSFHVFGSRAGAGTEVFSLLRESPLRPNAYLSAYFDTGTERQRGGKQPARTSKKARGA
jgi:hypothetical protein